jgi:predicted small lipoprotein YifL
MLRNTSFPGALLALSLLMLSLLALSGCGQKGPLYMPGDSESSKTYDPQGDYEDEQPASSKQTPGQSDSDAQRQQPTSPQANPAPAPAQPSAEALP